MTLKTLYQRAFSSWKIQPRWADFTLEARQRTAPGPPGWGLGMVPTTPPRKNAHHVMKTMLNANTTGPIKRGKMEADHPSQQGRRELTNIDVMMLVLFSINLTLLTLYTQ